ncbi:MAG TPA: YggS family pyridoxal phosphate-dependent enzyme [Chryseosolibacter sp.]|nr:YggS family pyridoxal phosphate-dependent enzyme [Chryseosolibacter sp.]
MTIQERLDELRRNIPAGCTLIAVSKTQPPEKIQEAYAAGQRVFGENRAQELATKYDALPKDIIWHMIGHLQTNKVKYIAPFVGLIHSVDSLKLLEEINRQGFKLGRIIPCLLQIHIAEEESKFGFLPKEVSDLIASTLWADMKHIEIKGLMGMATFTSDEQQVRREFRSLKALFEKLRGAGLPAPVKMEELSMGMSGDYKIALEEGSTMVRVGTAIFGLRN